MQFDILDNKETVLNLKSNIIETLAVHGLEVKDVRISRIGDRESKNFSLNQRKKYFRFAVSLFTSDVVVPRYIYVIANGEDMLSETDCRKFLWTSNLCKGVVISFSEFVKKYASKIRKNYYESLVNDNRSGKK